MDSTVFPPNISSFEDLQSFIERTPAALANCYFSIDYDAPTTLSCEVDGSAYKGDGSAYTVEGRPFHATLFGQVATAVASLTLGQKYMKQRATFLIKSHSDAGPTLCQMFADQANSISVAVLHDDRRDQARKEVWVSMQEGVDASGSTYMEIDVDRLRYELYRRDVGGVSLVPSLPVGDLTLPFHPGDWVVFEATLHKSEIKQPYPQRDYSIRATRTLLLQLGTSHDTDGFTSPAMEHADPLLVTHLSSSSGSSMPLGKGAHEYQEESPPNGSDLSDTHTLDSVDMGATPVGIAPETARVLTPDLYLEDLEAMETPRTKRKRHGDDNDGAGDAGPSRAKRRGARATTVNIAKK
ncbi:hypothetical protein B0H11DRAFT_1927394 [Mycena galericulata]|nr:hypothetical protein B0H11DRAFT_1927394 [Mycena galericulata]